MVWLHYGRHEGSMLSLLFHLQYVYARTSLCISRLDKSISSVDNDDREKTKRVAYSVLYGVGKEKLSEYLKTSTEDAKAIIQSFNCTKTGLIYNLRSFTMYNTFIYVMK